MKKLFLPFMLCFVISVAGMAQTSNPGKATTTADANKKITSKKVATKKDGSPDMRYKENKVAKATTGPAKKDGTPDMRYKKNKAAAKPKS